MQVFLRYTDTHPERGRQRFADDVLSSIWSAAQYNNVERWWHRARADLANRVTNPARAQLLRTKLDIHCLRHTFSTVAQELCAAQAKIQQQLGHASSTMTRHYTHPSLDSQRAAVALFQTPNRCVTAASEFGA